MTATLKPFKLPGNYRAYVVLGDGREIGTIAKCKHNSAWSAVAGIGMEGRNVGGYLSQKLAILAVLRAALTKEVAHQAL